MSNMKHVSLEILTFQTLSELIENSIRRYGDRPAFGTKTQTHYEWITYSEFGIQLGKLRTLFKRHGVKKGDRIAIIANNSVEFALSIYAAYGLGAVIVPMYEVQKVQDWEYILSDAQPKIVIVGSDSIREKIESFHAEGLEHIFTIRTEDATDPNRLSNLIASESETTDADASVSEDDLADIIYTSGKKK